MNPALDLRAETENQPHADPMGDGNVSGMGSKYDNLSRVHGQESVSRGADADTFGFEDFVHEQYRSLVKFLHGRTATPQDAEDAAQESMTRMLRYRRSTPCSAWRQLLYRIAINVAHDQFRTAVSHRSAQHVTLEERSLAAPDRSPDEQAAYEEQLVRLRKAIAELPPKCQRVYLLKRIHDMSHAQVAERCGISVKTVEKHLTRALVILRRKVGSPTAGTSE